MLFFSNNKEKFSKQIAKPTISKDYIEPVIVNAGTSLVLEVPFTGSPQPRVIWKYNNLLLQESYRVGTSTVHNLTSVDIRRIEKSDAGIYTILLENEHGSARIDVEVTVLGKNKSY